MEYVVLGTIFVLIISILILFSFPQFSPIPYFPSNKKDIPLILTALDLKNGQTVIDLGAGDGVVIFTAAAEAFRKKLDTQFYADEINPVLLGIMWVRRLFHPNKKNIHLINRDMFTMSFNQFQPISTNVTFYIYISPWHIEKTVANIKKNLKSFRLVSYFYRIDCLPEYTQTVTKGVHTVYGYNRKYD